MRWETQRIISPSYMLSLSFLWDIQMKMSSKQAARLREKLGLKVWDVCNSYRGCNLFKETKGRVRKGQTGNTSI